MDRARRSMEEELYRKLEEDGGKKMIFKMARDRTEDGRDVKRGAVIKDNNGRLITESQGLITESQEVLMMGRQTSMSC